MNNKLLIEDRQQEREQHGKRVTSAHMRTRFSLVAVLLVLYLTGVVVAIAPLEQLAGHPVAGRLPGTLLRPLGLWLPTRLVLLCSRALPFLDKADLTFHFWMLVLFLLYGTVLWLVWNWVATARQRCQLLGLVGSILLIGGGILVVAPGMLSHDIFVYAGYGRVIVAHGANPYFVPLSAFPNDPLTPLDDWKTAVAAYGPLWLLVCAALSWLLGANAVAYVLAFRLLALAAHLLNMALIVLILRALGRSERVIAVGGILYGLNPLMLIESALGAHNDVLMMTGLLLGCWCCADAEGARLEQTRYWLPALVLMLVAALIKFTALLGVALFLCLLLMRTLRPEGSQRFLPALRRYWRPALAQLLLALGCGLCVGGLAYFPFWVGHSPHEIMISLVAPPSTSRELGQFSILRAIQEWRHYHPQPLQGMAGQLLALLGQRSTWNALQGLALLVALGGALWLLWKQPQLQRWAVGSLLTMGAIFLVTPWFFPWYLAWLIALAPLALPLSERSKALEYALQVFVLVFSLSAFAIYLSRGYVPAKGGWIGWMGLSAVAPPSLAFGLAWLGGWWQTRRRSSSSSNGGLLLRPSGP
ncbi:hypothetical protein [Thermogemmatispora sp.]|uniref:hypothetical protein n=1 Tax=Thermogemmatispora sp. TaxID=1968838 RepID=UPI001D1C5D9F|nr:hypothetical protein [Thermogemmatispora sp.]MBX5450500.1 DUF2029 domain-containing protein [Thermogemmatispora sp.]